MSRKPLILVLFLVTLSGVVGAVALQASSSFLGAPAGVPVASQLLTLPPVSGGPALRPRHPFEPTFDELTSGETVVTSEKQWRVVRQLLFPAGGSFPKVNFEREFVVIMGGGLMSVGDFEISSVERVDASWASFFGGSIVDPHLAVTATTLLPGVAPPVPPPPTYRVSAVRIPRTELRHTVHHREVIALP